MNFFKSVFAEDPDSPTSSSPASPTHQPVSTSDGSESDQPDPSPVWTFGGLIKTLQVKRDWIDTYRRDLEEFGSGLKKETQVLREVASNSLDIGASKAQVSLESMGQALDSIGFVMADIITHGKESLSSLDNENSSDFNNISVNSGRYSRFDAQLRAIQSDVSTYVENPDDIDDYNKWVLEFDMGEKSEEIEGLMRDNGSIEGFYKRVVPDVVDHDVFWYRYFYRVYRLKQAENVRAELVKRAISTEEEEELSWDVDDEEEEEGVKKVVQKEENEKRNVAEEHELDEEAKKKGECVEATDNVSSKANEDGETSKKLKEKVVSEPSECGKESDISVVSTQPSTEDDMGWDEIEDIGSGDEKKDTRSMSPNREELRKRLSIADEDEDLSWDIEDDD